MLQYVGERRMVVASVDGWCSDVFAVVWVSMEDGVG